MRPSPITRAARLVLAVIGAAAAILMLGPFQGAEHLFFLTDKEAHVLAFYGLTTLGFLAAPTLRKNDITLAAFAMAGAIELAQGAVGREVSAFGLAAGVLGASMAWAGAQSEALRRRATSPDRRRRSQGFASDGTGASPVPVSSTPPV